MADATAITLHASSAETADGSGTAADIGTLRTCLELRLDVTAVSGTFAANEGLTVTVETSTDGLTGWAAVASFAVQAAVGVLDKIVPGCRQFVRVSWAITGTGSPSFTFAVTGQAHVLYAEIADLNASINAVALQDLSDEDKARHLLDATADMETALNSAFELPLTAWGRDVRKVTADRAVFYSVSERGFRPGSSLDQLIIQRGGVMIEGRRCDAQKFLDDISSGKKKPVGVVDQTPETYEGAGFVISDTPRV